MGEDGNEAWLRERCELLTRLAEESARSARLAQQLQDREALRAEPLVAREAGARLLAREAERHRAELGRLQEAERVALDRAELLTRQLRELRSELHSLQAQHATERMQAELELARAKAEAAGLQAAARRRAEQLRPTPAEREARRAQQLADEALLAQQAPPEPASALKAPAQPDLVQASAPLTPADRAPELVDPVVDPVIVPPEWAEPAPEEQPEEPAHLNAVRARRSVFRRR